MQYGIPLDIGKLNLAFEQHDSDQDGQVTDSQVDLIMKQIGYQGFYIGAIRKVKLIPQSGH
jgi:hypothetical protein